MRCRVKSWTQTQVTLRSSSVVFFSTPSTSDTNQAAAQFHQCRQSVCSSGLMSSVATVRSCFAALCQVRSVRRSFSTSSSLVDFTVRFTAATRPRYNIAGGTESTHFYNESYVIVSTGVSYHAWPPIGITDSNGNSLVTSECGNWSFVTDRHSSRQLPSSF